GPRSRRYMPRGGDRTEPPFATALLLARFRPCRVQQCSTSGQLPLHSSRKLRRALLEECRNALAIVIRPARFALQVAFEVELGIERIDGGFLDRLLRQAIGMGRSRRQTLG